MGVKDFDVQCDGQSIVEIDGRSFSFCADRYLDVDAGELSQCSGFVDLMTLFMASVGYCRALRKSVDRHVKSMLSGQGHRQVVCDEELRLRHNGRAAA
jgi:hypothetical protein